MVTVGGGDGSEAIRLYDFQCPQRMTAALRTALATDQTRLAEGLARRLSKQLRTTCAVQSSDIVEDRAGRVLETPRTVVFRLSPSSDTGVALVSIEPALAQAFVDCLLGGTPAAREVERDPTNIEVAVLGLLAEGIGEYMGRAFPAYLSTGEDPAYVGRPERTALAERMGIVASLEVELGETRGGMCLFFDHGVLDRISGRASDEESGAGADHRMTADTLGRVRLEVKAQFPSEPVRIRDIASLAVGDVLFLGRRLSDEAEVRVGGRLAFFGHPGAVDGGVGIQISRTR